MRAASMDFETARLLGVRANRVIGSAVLLSGVLAAVVAVLEPIEKWEFYKAVNTPDHVLTIQTADQQRFANVLLFLGVRMG